MLMTLFGRCQLHISTGTWAVLGEGFLLFSLFLLVKCWDSTSVLPWLHPYKSFPVHYFPVVLWFHFMQSQCSSCMSLVQFIQVSAKNNIGVVYMHMRLTLNGILKRLQEEGGAWLIETDMVGWPEIISHQVRQKYLILLMHGSGLSCLLKYNSWSLSSWPLLPCSLR